VRRLFYGLAELSVTTSLHRECIVSMCCGTGACYYKHFARRCWLGSVLFIFPGTPDCLPLPPFILAHLRWISLGKAESFLFRLVVLYSTRYRAADDRAIERDGERIPRKRRARFLTKSFPVTASFPYEYSSAVHKGALARFIRRLARSPKAARRD
jgi:hypothetical protein